VESALATGRRDSSTNGRCEVSEIEVLEVRLRQIEDRVGKQSVELQRYLEAASPTKLDELIKRVESIEKMLWKGIGAVAAIQVMTTVLVGLLK